MIDGLPRRVWICGLSGSGKTTVARRVATILDVPHVELDALHWRHRPDWGMPSDEEFLPEVREATAGDAWVVEGNYSRSRDIFWPRVELMVWLDLPLRTTCWRVLSADAAAGSTKGSASLGRAAGDRSKCAADLGRAGALEPAGVPASAPHVHGSHAGCERSWNGRGPVAKPARGRCVAGRFRASGRAKAPGIDPHVGGG